MTIANLSLYGYGDPEYKTTLEMIEEELREKLRDSSNRSKWIRFTNNHVFNYGGYTAASAEKLLERYPEWETYQG
jgi:hypothetical protein